MDVGQAKVETLVPIGQPFVVDAQQVKDRGVQVVDMHGAGRPLALGRPDHVAVGVGNVVGVVVRLAIGDAGLDAAAGHPCGEAAWMMVSPVVRLCQLALAVGGAAEFAAPDYQGLVEHAALP